MNFFETNKRGEIYELKSELSSNNYKTIKEAVKKIISEMTIGKDVSFLFPDIIKNMNTDNLELKKLIYLYIINHAHNHPEQAILVINTFSKDATTHSNPLVRALAIRTMGCIRVNKITEYLCDPLSIALKDKDPYVRKTAVICVAKLYKINKELVKDRGFLNQLILLLSDQNPMVVSNTLGVLSEISEKDFEFKLSLNASSITKLMTALNECTEWGQISILELLSKTTPTSKNASFIIERVISRLSHINSSIILSTIKLIIIYLDYLKDQKFIKTIYNKIKPSLITLLSSNPEIQYITLKNLHIIMEKIPNFLKSEIRIFYVKYNDMPYIKCEKIKILSNLIDKRNYLNILLELKEYAFDIDTEFSRQAVFILGDIAIKHNYALISCIKIFKDLITNKTNRSIINEIIISMKKVLRLFYDKYLFHDLIDLFTKQENINLYNESTSIEVLLWIIGEYSSEIKNSEKIMRYFATTFEENELNVKYALLNSAVKMYVHTPDTKRKNIIKNVLNKATKEKERDLVDRAYFYWNMLSKHFIDSKLIVLSLKQKNYRSLKHKSDLKHLTQYISTIASIYHIPPEKLFPNSNTTFTKIKNKLNVEDNVESSSSENIISENVTIDNYDFRPVLSERKGNGFQVDIKYVRKNNRTFFVFMFLNQHDEELRNVSIKLDKNFLGLEFVKDIKLVKPITPQSTQTIYQEVKIVPKLINKSKKMMHIQMAIKILRKNYSVYYFYDKLDLSIFFQEKGQISKKSYLKMWDSKECVIEKDVVIKRKLILNTFYENFKKINIFHIVTNEIKIGKVVYFSLSISDIITLIEIEVKDNSVGICIKSDDAYYLKIVLFYIMGLSLFGGSSRLFE